jgi:membrane associated rhomboid family serine protease
MSVADQQSRRSNAVSGVLLVVAMAALMWLVEGVDQLSGGSLEQYGIRPRDADGLAGVGAAPFLHATWAHLIANTIPFLVLGAVIGLSGLGKVLKVTMIVAAVAGLGTWLTAPEFTVHVGASGIVFGYATYLITRGAFSRSLLHLAAGAIVLAVYGSTLILGVAPETGISWQGHLFGGIGGVVAAAALDRRSTRNPADSII